MMFKIIMIFNYIKNAVHHHHHHYNRGGGGGCHDDLFIYLLILSFTI